MNSINNHTWETLTVTVTFRYSARNNAESGLLKIEKSQFAFIFPYAFKGARPLSGVGRAQTVINIFPIDEEVDTEIGSTKWYFPMYREILPQRNSEEFSQ